MADAPRYRAGFFTGVGRVVAIESVGPRMRRLRIRSADFVGLDCGDGPAPGVRVLIPPAGHPVIMPTASLEDGLVYPDGAEPSEPRTLTIRANDPVVGTIDVDVATTHEGVLVEWARTVQVGAEVGYAGPRHFPVLPDGPLVLIGDESALPAIGAIVDQSVRSGREIAWIAVEVGSSEDEIDLAVPAAWVRRADEGRGTAIADFVASQSLPSDAVVWIASEARMARALRNLIAAMRPAPAHVRASGYWRSGTTSSELDDRILELTQRLVADGASTEVLDEFALAFE